VELKKKRQKKENEAEMGALSLSQNYFYLWWR